MMTKNKISLTRVIHSFCIFVCVLMLVFVLGSCGNKQIVDLTYTFDYAIIQMPNGDIIEGKLDRWKDYEGEQLQVTINGVTYLVSSVNCVLISDPSERAR